MTWPNPRRAAPVARISQSALLENARLLRTTHPDAIADLRRDAWGHGVDTVARAVADAGIRAVSVDAADSARVAALGLAPTTEAPDDSAVLYGLPGSGGATALALVSPVLSTKRLLAGEGVSYGYTHRAIADTRVALVAGGYAEGVVRALGNRVTLDVAGRLRPVVGRVAMDVCVVDVGDVPAEAGDEAVFFGAGAAGDNLSDWVRATGMTAAELVCAVGLHVHREVAA